MTCDEIKAQFQELSNNLLAVNGSITTTQNNINALSLTLSTTDVAGAIPLLPYTQQAAQARATLCQSLSGQWNQLAQYLTSLAGYQATAEQLQGQLTSLIQQWNSEGCQGSISGS